MLQIANETVIVSALKQGQMRRAVELMLDSYQDQLYSYCARLTGHYEAGAVYYQVLLAAINDLGSFDGQTSIRAFLFGVARKIVILHHHRHLPDFPQAMLSGYAPVQGPDSDLRLLVDDPRVAEYCTSLAPPVLEVLQLSLWHDLPLTEIAHIITRPLLEVRQMMALGLSANAARLCRPEARPS